MGPKDSSQTLVTALAMGADRGIHVEAQEGIEPLNIAKMFKKLVEKVAWYYLSCIHFPQKDTPSIVLLGKQAIDGDNNQTVRAGGLPFNISRDKCLLEC